MFANRMCLVPSLLLCSAAPSLKAQSDDAHGAALAIALTPASTFVTMNPAVFGDPPRGAFSLNSAHKPAWRTAGGSASVDGFRIQAGKSHFLGAPGEKHYFVGIDYGRRLFDLGLGRSVHFIAAADASAGRGATEFQGLSGFGELGQTAGVIVPVALKLSVHGFEVIPYYAPGAFFGRYTFGSFQNHRSNSGRRLTEGGGIRFSFFDRAGIEWSVRKTLISDAIPRYGVGMWFSATPLPHGVTSEITNLRFEMDNDFYTFWLPPQKRPDVDYTNGLRVSASRTTPVRGLGRLTSHLPFCSRMAAADPCGSARVELGQEIYTPVDDAVVNLFYDRPYAGWLYAGYSAHVSTPVEDRVTTIRVGVVGPPSMAQGVQTAFHRLFPWARHPVGWDTQLRFEPGVIASYSRNYLLGTQAIPSRVLQLVPEWKVSVGNVLTGASVAGSARIGYHLSNPWFVSSGASPGRFSIFAFGKEREDLVLHDIFLDGNTFRNGRSVERVPFVWQEEAGGGFRIGAVTVEYRAVERQREYRPRAIPSNVFRATLPRSISVAATHPYGSISITVDRAF
jgi:lipid A 3-O-deacylase